MDEQAIRAALSAAERSLDEGNGVKGTGFWKAVGAARRDPGLADRFADRMGRIDRRAFESGVKMRMPLVPGVLALAVVTAVGVAAVVLAVRAATSPEDEVRLLLGRDLYGLPAFVPVSFLIGLGALLVGPHSLAHWVTGRVVGIRFTHVFLGGPPPPRPGVKTDYASYLRASPRSRAFMHASGAVLTKIVPFALVPAALTLYREGWPFLLWLTLVLGAGQILTDIFLSTKVSDWKKVKRELRAARGE